MDLPPAPRTRLLPRVPPVLPVPPVPPVYPCVAAHTGTYRPVPAGDATGTPSAPRAAARHPTSTARVGADRPRRAGWRRGPPPRAGTPELSVESLDVTEMRLNIAYACRGGYGSPCVAASPPPTSRRPHPARPRKPPTSPRPTPRTASVPEPRRRGTRGRARPRLSTPARIRPPRGCGAHLQHRPGYRHAIPAVPGPAPAAARTGRHAGSRGRAPRRARRHTHIGHLTASGRPEALRVERSSRCSRP